MSLIDFFEKFINNVVQAEIDEGLKLFYIELEYPACFGINVKKYHS